MRTKLAIATLSICGAAFATPVAAEEVTGANRLLCAAVEAIVCGSGAECFAGPPWDWDIPEFVEIDLKAKTLSTTKAAPRLRTTPILHLERTQGLIVLQGVEAGRAFSFVVEENTGQLSAAVARDGITVTVFGSCTPAAATP
jgi:hypothetical protein